MTELEQIGEGFVRESRAQWANLVSLARKVSPARRDDLARTLSQAAGVGKSTLRRKIEAIHEAMKAGLTDEKLVEMGQSAVMGKFVKDKRAERTEDLVVLKWMVASDLKYAVQDEVWRIAQVLGFKTSDEFWEFMCSVMVGWSEAEILHLAGEGQKNAPRKTTAAG